MLTVTKNEALKIRKKRLILPGNETVVGIAAACCIVLTGFMDSQKGARDCTLLELLEGEKNMAACADRRTAYC